MKFWAPLRTKCPLHRFSKTIFWLLTFFIVIFIIYILQEKYVLGCTRFLKYRNLKLQKKMQPISGSLCSLQWSARYMLSQIKNFAPAGRFYMMSHPKKVLPAQKNGFSRAVLSQITPRHWKLVSRSLFRHYNWKTKKIVEKYFFTKF